MMVEKDLGIQGGFRGFLHFEKTGLDECAFYSKKSTFCSVSLIF